MPIIQESSSVSCILMLDYYFFNWYPSSPKLNKMTKTPPFMESKTKSNSKDFRGDFMETISSHLHKLFYFVHLDKQYPFS